MKALRVWRRVGGFIFWLAGAVLTPALFAQPAREPYSPAIIDPADGARRLQLFREARLAGDFCLRFRLTHYPRRGEVTQVYDGFAWGTWNEQGPLTRFQLRPVAPGGAPPDPAQRDAHTWEWLVQNGPHPRAWVLPPGAEAAREIPPAQWREPLFPGLVYTPFDLLMPYVYWTDYEYRGPDKALGMVCDVFELAPPAGAEPALAPVRVALVREYKVLVRAEQLDAARHVARRFTVVSFKLDVQDQPLVTALDLLDTRTRDHDRLDVRAASLRLRLDPALFDAAQLAQPAGPPPGAEWKNL